MEHLIFLMCVIIFICFYILIHIYTKDHQKINESYKNISIQDIKNAISNKLNSGKTNKINTQDFAKNMNNDLFMNLVGTSEYSFKLNNNLI